MQMLIKMTMECQKQLEFSAYLYFCYSLLNSVGVKKDVLVTTDP